MTNKPQLSAEMEKKIKQVFYDRFHFPITYDMKNALGDMASILATALEEERKNQFTLSELKIIAMDYQALLSTNKIMGMSIQGDGELAQSMVNQEVVRQQIFEKVKDKMPVNKEDLLLIKPRNSLTENK